MDLFRILINRILHKIPLKLLLLIVIFLFLAFFCFNAKEVKAVSEPNLSDYINHINNNQWCIVQNTSSNVYYLIASDGDYNINTSTLNNTGSIPTTTGTFVVASSWYVVQNAQPFKVYSFDTTTNTFVLFSTVTGGAINNSVNLGNCNILYNGSRVFGFSTSTGTRVADLYISYNPYVPPSPSIVNSSDVATWSFDNLIIDSGTVKARYTVIEDNVQYEYIRTFKLETTYQGVVYTTDLRPYMTIDNDGYATFTIPKNELSNHFNIYNGNSIMFDLFVQPDDSPNSTGNWSTYSLGTYTFTLTDAEQEQINADSEKQVLGDINSSIQETNENINNLNSNITELNNTQEETNNKIDNLESSITSSNYSSSDLSNTMHNFGNGFVVTDNTHLEELFTMLYNAFCNNQVVNLTFTIPFVNKTVTISSENISSNYPTQLVTVVHLFVWGTIGLYIIKDIRSMINKMAEGNIENISSDVKKEVL